MGVADFINKPFSEPVLLNRVKYHVDISELIRERTEQLRHTHRNLVFVLADMVENRDASTGGHIERTARFVRILIDGMRKRGVYADEIADWDSGMMADASLLHDVGKISITDAILNKSGKLTPEEFEIIKSHTLTGKSITEKVIARTGEDIFLQYAKLFTTYHHERWDGTGYPYGLAGKDIPLLGRMMAIVDVYDALSSKRSYKEPFSEEETVSIMIAEKGKQFDPNILDVFYELRDEFKAVRAAFEENA